VEDGEIVFGEMKRGDEAKAAKALLKEGTVDFGLLDKAVDEIVWKFANLFPGCLQKSIDGIRAKKKVFWDQTKLANRHWLAANMMGEALLGFNAFNTKKITGTDVIDFIKYRQLVAQGQNMDESLFEQVLGKPQGE
jgi:6-oxo-cyclohex-1-ene-carbonyl-CoA hydrolase